MLLRTNFHHIGNIVGPAAVGVTGYARGAATQSATVVATPPCTPTLVRVGEQNFPRLAAEAGVAHNPQGPETSFDPAEPGVSKRVQKGGSFLCIDQYCTRYMVGTRGKSEPSTAANHTGFRCVKSPNQSIVAVPARKEQ